MLQKLWYDRPVRAQLLLAVAAINLFAALMAGAVSILNTRTATRVEIEASLEVAQRFVAVTMKDLVAKGQLNQLEQVLPLQLKHLRHVRIMFMDVLGQLNVISPQPGATPAGEAQESVPDWFVALVKPQIGGRAVRVVAVDGSNPIIITGEPSDEIAEAWNDFSSLAVVWLGLSALILGILYLVLGRVLDPLASLSKGMLKLEDGQYGTRMEPPKVKELAVITERFNTLAGALDSTASSSACRRKSGARSPPSCTTKPAPACSASPPTRRRSGPSPTSSLTAAPPRFPGASAKSFPSPSGSR